MRGNARVLAMLAADGWLVWTRRPNWAAVGDCIRAATRIQAGYGADRYIIVLASAALWLAGCWLAMGLSATLLGSLPGRGGSLARAFAAAVLPRAARTLLVAVTTTSVSLSAVTGTADAIGPRGTPTSPGQPVATSPAWPALPALPALPAPPARPAQPAPPALPTQPTPLTGPQSGALTPQWPTTTPVTGPSVSRAAPDGSTLVQPGDSLWRIAARHLEPRASEAEIADLWPRWFAANRAVVGADPNLIKPGTELVDPEAAGR